MDLLEFGSTGYQIGALGIVAFAVSFFAVVRWWTDLLGRVLAFVFGITSLVLLVSAYRSLTQIDSHGFLTVRAIVYWVFGIGIWTGLISFYWFQFFAPRIRHRTTRREDERHEQEADVAAGRSARDGGSDDRAGRHG
jgi:phosphotransferase system  glucose/maltose/N-acetylglucosamine-specific IIC component